MRTISRNSWKCVLLGVLACACSMALAAQSSPLQRRITQPIDENNRVTLSGNVPHRALGKYDQGTAPDGLLLHRMILMLKRSPDQEAALQQLIEAQQTTGSSNYHQWLTPQQFGAQFGVSDDDIQTVTGWLESHGFVVAGVSPSKMSVEFSGTAGQVKLAFHTQIHRFVMADGNEHWSNVSDPQIPAALAPAVAGTLSLDNFERRAMVRNAGVFRRDNTTGKVTPKTGAANFGIANCGGTQGRQCNALSPADFNTIYDVPATINSNPPGQGQTIAITGDSEICTASSPDFSECSGNDDVALFRGLFGLSTSNLPQIITAGPDPGFNSDETEGDLDTQWAGAIAPNAQILFVIGENTEATAGIDLAAEYIVDNNLAPVLSESFGACELNLSADENEFYETLWEQAAAQGITVVISAGDSGAAGCDDPNAENEATEGLQVNGIASTPYNVAAGGTDFNINTANYQSTFWNTTNAANGESAKSYIPETTWNDSCAQAGLTGCTNASGSTVNIVGGGGGESNCSFGVTQCVAGYAKPSWQTGTGVPNDGVRDIPDISLFAADGAVSGSFYIVCESDLDQNDAPCSLSTVANPFPFTDFVGVGGTSAAAPTFAAIMSLLNQSTGQRQGNVNYTLYAMAANNSTAFHDITVGNNSVACTGGVSLDCSSINGIGVLEEVNSNGTAFLNPNVEAFDATVGYDLATGLGSVDAAKLISLWTGGGSQSTTTTMVSPASVSITHGASVNFHVTVTPAPPNNTPSGSTGSPNNPEFVALIGTCINTNPNCFGVAGSNTASVDKFTSNSYVLANADTWQLVSGTATGSTSALVGCIPASGQTTCSYNLTAHYPGDGTRQASDSSPITVTVNPETSSVQVQALNFNLNCNTQNCVTPVTSAPYGSFILVRTDVFGAVSQEENATGTVTIADTAPNCPSALCGSFPLNPEGYAEAQTPNLSFPGNLSNLGIPIIPPLSVGAHNFSATYSGDGSYKASATSTHAQLTITTAPTATTITSAPSSVTSGSSFQMTALVDTNSIGVAPTGTVTFFNGSTQLGSPVAVTATSDSSGFVAANATITATLTSNAAPLIGPSGRHMEWIPIAGLALALICGALILAIPMKRRYALVGASIILFSVALALTGCGGGGGSSNNPPPSTNGSITAKYSGDGNYVASTSTVVTIAIH
jgi:hypothetical protein